MASNYPNGKDLIISGVPLTITNPGKVFFVSNASTLLPGQIGGSNGNDGSFNKPYATINYAVTQCVANRGDIVFVKCGHAETISSASILAIGVAGVTIIGMGRGSMRPTLTFTAAAATINVTAANCIVYNILHKANFADVASAYTVSGTAIASDLTIDNCAFRDGSSILNFVKTLTGNATASSLDGLIYSNNRVNCLGTTAATQSVIVPSASSRMKFENNFVVYPALNNTAALVDFGANATLGLEMSGNRVYRPSTSTTGGSLFSCTSTACTGYVYDNYSWHLTAATALLAPTGTKLGFQNNFCMVSGAADKSGLINPAAV